VQYPGPLSPFSHLSIFLGFNPHLHVLASGGCFYWEGMFRVWRHSGFNVFYDPMIQPGDKNAMKSLARYIIRASFSQERMTYIPE